MKRLYATTCVGARSSRNIHPSTRANYLPRSTRPRRRSSAESRLFRRDRGPRGVPNHRFLLSLISLQGYGFLYLIIGIPHYRRPTHEDDRVGIAGGDVGRARGSNVSVQVGELVFRFGGENDVVRHCFAGCSVASRFLTCSTVTAPGPTPPVPNDAPASVGRAVGSEATPYAAVALRRPGRDECRRRPWTVRSSERVLPDGVRRTLR